MHMTYNVRKICRFFLSLPPGALWDMTNDFGSPHFAPHAIALAMMFDIHITFWNKYQPRETPGFGDILA